MKLCTYCGEIATTIDHVVPWSWNHSQERKRSGGNSCSNLTPACLDCNVRLGDVALFTITDRAWHLAGKIRAKIKKASKVKWTTEELSELGTQGFLRGHVERRIFELETMQRRLVNLEAHEPEEAP